MTATELRKISKANLHKGEPFSDTKEVRRHLLAMAKLGFTNTTVVLKKDLSGELELRLKGEGYTLYNETSLYYEQKDSVIISIEWDS